jgi:hypothetical protein
VAPRSWRTAEETSVGRPFGLLGRRITHGRPHLPNKPVTDQGGAYGAVGPALAPGLCFWEARPAHAGRTRRQALNQDGRHETGLPNLTESPRHREPGPPACAEPETRTPRSQWKTRISSPALFAESGLTRFSHDAEGVQQEGTGAGKLSAEFVNCAAGPDVIYVGLMSGCT